MIDMFRQVGRLLKNENIFLLIDLLIIICFHLLAWALMMSAFANFENNFYVYAAARAIINSLIFPILIFYLTLKYRGEEYI